MWDLTFTCSFWEDQTNKVEGRMKNIFNQFTCQSEFKNMSFFRKWIHGFLGQAQALSVYMRLYKN